MEFWEGGIICGKDNHSRKGDGSERKKYRGGEDDLYTNNGDTMCEAHANTNGEVGQGLHGAPILEMIEDDTTPKSVIEILGGLPKVRNTKGNKAVVSRLSQSPELSKVMGNSIGKDMYHQLAAKVGGNLDKVMELHEQVSSFGIDNAIQDLQKLMGEKKLHADTIEDNIFGKKTVGGIEKVNTFIQQSKDEQNGERTYRGKVPAIITENLYPLFAKMGIPGLQERHRTAVLEMNISGAVSQIEVLNDNRDEMESIVQGVEESAEKITESQQELYRQYVFMIYIVESLQHHISEKRSEVDAGNFDQVTRATKEKEIRKLERMATDVTGQAKFIEARAIMEIHNAERAEITAQNIKNEYLMTIYVLANKIDNYIKQEAIIKGVRLGVALQDLKNQAMNSFFDDAKLLNDLQTQLERSGVTFITDLNTQIQQLQANISKNQNALAHIDEEEKEALNKLSATINALEEITIPLLTDDKKEDNQPNTGDEIITHTITGGPGGGGSSF